MRDVTEPRGASQHAVAGGGREGGGMPRAFSALLLLMPPRPCCFGVWCARDERETVCMSPGQRKEPQGSSPIAAHARNRIICAVPNRTYSCLRIDGIIHSNLKMFVWVWVWVCTCACKPGAVEADVAHVVAWERGINRCQSQCARALCTRRVVLLTVGAGAGFSYHGHWFVHLCRRSSMSSTHVRTRCTS